MQASVWLPCRRVHRAFANSPSRRSARCGCSDYASPRRWASPLREKWEVAGARACSPIDKGGGRGASLVELVFLHLAAPVPRGLVAQQLRHPRVVLPQLDPDARGRVAVATRVEHRDVRDLPVVGDGVDALAVVAVGAAAGASRAGRQVQRGAVRGGPVGVPRDRRVLRAAEGGGHVVLPGPAFRLVVVAREVVVRGRRRAVRRGVLLEPEAELHVVAQQLGARVLVGVKQDPAVAAAAEAAGVRGGGAGGVVLLQQVASLVPRHAVVRQGAPLGEGDAPRAVGLTQLPRRAAVAEAGGEGRRREEEDGGGGVRGVVREGGGGADRGDEGEDRVRRRVEGVVLGGGAAEGAAEDKRAHAVGHRVGVERERRREGVAGAVLRLGAARADLPLDDARCGGDESVRLVRHLHGAQAHAEPDVRRTRENDRR
eukprot:CAMPEP_0182817452 /NCGR_PEP_ID=MMETSP0006_2-20121128/11478_1 /TAXON_ID=97485 /ORGANISM="Prymnesium parvum, Strain Texoma1" /LENGTH=427 /DNA_ID=CAMNT_0024943811 /DNA_START=518 /DNA_END=1798 /DNA_ORIENTATION=-